MSAGTAASPPRELIRESLRIAGEKVPRERVIEVRHPYSGALVGTVPKATLDDVRRVLRIARGYRATLAREWRPYLEGRRTLGEAITAIVRTLPQAAS